MYTYIRIIGASNLLNQRTTVGPYLFCSLISRPVSRDIESSIFFQEKDIRGIFLADSDGRITHARRRFLRRKVSLSLSASLSRITNHSTISADIISQEITAIFYSWRELILDIFQNSQDPRSTETTCSHRGKLEGNL